MQKMSSSSFNKAKSMFYKPSKLIGSVTIGIAVLLFLGGTEFASGTLLGNGANQFAVLGQFSANQTNINNGVITGDIGIGSPRQATFSNVSVVGNIRFSGASNTTGLTPDPDPGSAAGPFTVSGGGTVSGGVFINDVTVTNALNYTNDLSLALGGNTGTAASVTAGGSINASAGTLGTTASVDGNALGTYYVFTIGPVNFPNGIFTINGSATDQVVLNVGASANFHGQILLAGGLTSDNVLINMFGGNYITHTGGPTLDVNTNGLSTFGTWLDPNGGMSATHTDLQGRFFGGDVVNQQLVSGVNITAPPNVPDSGSAVALLGIALAGIEGARRLIQARKG
jgi:fibronectin-binding autotransporter adhesin